MNPLSMVTSFIGSLIGGSSSSTVAAAQGRLQEQEQFEDQINQIGFQSSKDQAENAIKKQMDQAIASAG